MQKEFKYEVPKISRGYSNQTLHINLSDGRIRSKPVTDEMKDIFIGGKGFDLWLLWNDLPKDHAVKWDDPENELCIATGPLGGQLGYPGAGKSIVTTVSPLTDIIIDSNVGGLFGPLLKAAGWDALAIQGKAAEDVLIVIDGDEGTVKIEPANDLPQDSHLLAQILTEKYAEDEKDRRNVSVVSSGPGADQTRMGCLNFSFYDIRRNLAHMKQAGRGGTGTVLRNKRIRAIVARSKRIKQDYNTAADPDLLKKAARKHTKEILELDSLQNRMRVVGTAHLPSIMDEFDLLPTMNFKYGSHPEAKNLFGDVFEKKYTDSGKGWDGCWRGCAVNCSHCVANHIVKTGPYKGQTVCVDGPEYETIAGCGSNWGVFDPDWVIEYNFYCDTYGLDTISVGTGIAFCMEIFEAGILNEERTGGLNLKFGNAEAAVEVIHQMAKGKGFGKIAGQGIRRMKKHFVEEYKLNEDQIKFMQDVGMEHKGLEYSEYVTKESLAQQGGYGLTLKGPQHDEAWLIFLDMVHNYMPTFEQKAENLHWFPCWRTWFGLMGLCKLPWNDITPADNKETEEPHKVPEHVENYAEFFYAITGRDIGETYAEREQNMIEISEKVYNFQRIFNIRLGKGLREHDANPPYRSVGPVTIEEYESRVDRYDKQLTEILSKSIEEVKAMPVEERHRKLREYREKQYASLQDATYLRRGWDPKTSVITRDKATAIFPDWVLKEVQPYISKYW
ncbi:MAG: aldehyde ferredoxin oxidoreductase family protein [Candidatus Hodarchaeales archaeon]|jgi:aldehyde:ferredoxin oxidoreductase